MRILATADLHYNVPRSRHLVDQLVPRMLADRPHAIMLLGDLAGADLAMLDECLDLFANFEGPKMLVGGNHDLWVPAGGSSQTRFERELLEQAHAHGFHYLEDKPLLVDGVGFAGTIGWYDYSFRLERLAIPLRFYQAKVGPGAAKALTEHNHLLGSDLTDEHFRARARWMDGVHVRFDVTDEQFTRHLLDKLEDHLHYLVDKTGMIVVGMHHVPFAQMVRYRGNPGWDFAAAFLGSARFGELLGKYPQVRYCLCGHSHEHKVHHTDTLTCINIGSTYRHKRYEVIETDTHMPSLSTSTSIHSHHNAQSTAPHDR